MFPTFTGSSRRHRTVNLSGQRIANPFAAHALSPVSGTGVSKAVAEAQAGRRQRQQEREELRAARTIQRTWRGHRVRAAVRQERRQALAQLYSPAAALPVEQRLDWALPLVLSALDVHQVSDLELLGRVCQDLLGTDLRCLLYELPPMEATPARFAHVLVRALDQNTRAAPTGTPPPPAILELLIRIVRTHPALVTNCLRPYYQMLAVHCRLDRPDDQSWVVLMQHGVVSPLLPDRFVPADFTRRAVYEFAACFLTQPVGLLEARTVSFLEGIDPVMLYQAVSGLAAGARGEKPAKTVEELLWLLAHLIDRQNNLALGAPNSAIHFKTTLALLSALAYDIHMRYPTRKPNTGAQEAPPVAADYRTTQIQSLARGAGIAGLLSKFGTVRLTGGGEDYASLLAGYGLVLIRCFPDEGDEIRMRFFLADFSTASGAQPAMKFFWEASRATSLFARILASPQDALACLLQRKHVAAAPAASAEETLWDREWRTILMFLELYTFVLRLTDDDDFFSAFAGDLVPFQAAGGAAAAAPTSRLRSSALPLDALKALTLFLKNLAFTLHYNAAELLQNDTEGARQTGFLSRSHGGGRSAAARVGNYHVIAGMDLDTFKSIVTIAIQMLYERDSRRPFLPSDHWLMTSSFEMTQFLQAAVAEEQRQRELRRQSSGDAALDADDTDGDEDHDGGDEHDVHGHGGEHEDEPGHGSGRPVVTTLSGAFARTSRYAMLERMRQQRKHAQQERLMAAIGPKLEILRNMPYVIPFETRVKIFRAFVELDKERRREGFLSPDAWRAHIMERHGGWGEGSPARTIMGRHSARIRRDAVFDSAYEQFFALGEGLKEPIQITFVDEYGNEEAGIDGGGVTKEFLTCALTEELNPATGLFEANGENAIFPNPRKYDQFRHRMQKAGAAVGSGAWKTALADLLGRYEFIGRVIGKCLYEGILINFAFAGFFLRKWAVDEAAYRVSINDLRDMDEALYEGMVQLKNYAGDVGALEQDFTVLDEVQEEGEARQVVTRALIPHGDQVRVTKENRPLYISYVAKHRLVQQPEAVTQAFLRGLGLIIDPAWLRMFNASELQRLVGGDSSEIDVEDLRRHTVYSGVYEIGDDGEEHATVKLFWEVVRSLADADRRLLLQYVTSTPRGPLLGFAQLSPQFSIRDGGGDETRLPSASTCVNLLKLPRYKSAQTLREKLLYAIRSNARFDLS